MVTRPRSPRFSSVRGKDAYHLFYPQVAMAICSSHDSLVGSMTAVSCMSISNKPPLVALAISIGARTNRIIRKSNKFSINWFDYRKHDLRRLLLDLAAHSISLDKLQANDTKYEIKQGIPVICECAAYALCEVMKIDRRGDHDLVIAQILKARVKTGVFRKYWNFKMYEPTVYVGSNEPKPLQTIKVR